MKEIGEISGLRWIYRNRISNGEESFVVPFPDVNPVSIVDHGFKEFSYDQYGIHLGQADILTFLGSENEKITAHFIDCRKNSETFGKRIKENFYPSTEKTLYIPPGVAHRFDNLSNVYTINNFKLFLPTPKSLFKKDSNWNPGRRRLGRSRRRRRGGSSGRGPGSSRRSPPPCRARRDGVVRPLDSAGDRAEAVRHVVLRRAGR